VEFKPNGKRALFEPAMPYGSQIDQLSSVINFAARGLTMLCVTIDDELVAMFGLKSVIRLGAAGVVQELTRRQIAVHLVSGDATHAVHTVARDLNIPMESVAAEKNPGTEAGIYPPIDGQW